MKSFKKSVSVVPSQWSGILTGIQFFSSCCDEWGQKIAKSEVVLGLVDSSLKQHVNHYLSYNEPIITNTYFLASSTFKLILLFLSEIQL